MRLAGTAVICVLAAFGAAFLVGRAIDHQPVARAGTTSTYRTTAVVIPATTTTNAELVSEFAPMLGSLKHKPRPRRRHVVHSSPAVSPSTPVTPVQPTTTPSEPVPSPEPYNPPASSSSGTGGGHPTHKKTGGSGTTTIG